MCKCIVFHLVIQFHHPSPKLTALKGELTNMRLPNLQVIDSHLAPKSVAAGSDLEKDLCAWEFVW